jgi:hypothetical protein
LASYFPSRILGSVEPGRIVAYTFESLGFKAAECKLNAFCAGFEPFISDDKARFSTYGGPYMTALAAGDVNGDGKPDLVAGVVANPTMIQGNR